MSVRLCLVIVTALIMSACLVSAMSIQVTKGGIKSKGIPIKEKCCLPNQITFQSNNYDFKGKVTKQMSYYDFDKLLIRKDWTVENQTNSEIVIGEQSGMMTYYEFNSTKCTCARQFDPIVVCYDLDGSTDGEYLGIKGKKVNLSQGKDLDISWYIKKDNWDKETCVPLNTVFVESDMSFYEEHFNFIEAVNPTVFKLPPQCKNLNC